MKKLLLLILLSTLLYTRVSAQVTAKDQLMSASDLKEDLAFFKQQLYTVHVYPYTELTRVQYDALFDSIAQKLTDSITATNFLKFIKPIMAHLCDEHAQAYIPENKLPDTYRKSTIYLPFTLTQNGNTYRIDKILSAKSNLKPGEVITKIDGKALKDLVDDCALFSSGYADQRREKALKQFGYLYTWTLSNISDSYSITGANSQKVSVQGVALNVWQQELNRQSGWESACDEAISYQKIKDAGYINACSFNIKPKQLDSIKTKIDEIFSRIAKDRPKYLFIDVSKNSGGQSVIGSELVDNFYDKPYKTYSQDFKKSEAYVKLLRSWHIEPQNFYKEAPEGKVFHFPSDTVLPPQTNPNRFTGKVFLIVGNGTFSSAMMMATWIKDNHMATIAGETPTIGHPNGFGELYNTKLPHSGINILFGVKRWIRPSGDLKDNLLQPDIEVQLTDNKEELIRSILNKAK